LEHAYARARAALVGIFFQQLETMTGVHDRDSWKKNDTIA